MVYKHMKKCSTSVIGHKRNTNQNLYDISHLPATIMTLIHNTDNISISKGVEKLEASNIADDAVTLATSGRPSKVKKSYLITQQFHSWVYIKEI